ncbi:MAG TPA: PEGA domain-containing protein, partial [Polyangiaceae bacterium]|nr:PEGA domain-containing protein [Polyangiaceae bacterium]
DLNAAKKHYSEGEKKFKAGDFTGALADFKEANDIKPTPQAERYLGLAEDGLGHYQAAVEWYEKFLAHVPDKLASQGDELRKREAEIKAMPGKVHIDSTPAGATVAIDDKPQTTPTPLDVELPPGTHAVKFTATGRVTQTKSVDVAYASTQTLAAELEAEAAPPAPLPPTPVAAAVPATAPTPTPPPAEPRSKVPAFVTGGLAVAAAAVGTVFGVIALGDKSDFDKNPTTSKADDGDTHALIADMAFGVALTFGVTSAVLFLTKDEAPATPPTSSASSTKHVAKAAAPVTFSAAPIVGPHVGGAGLSLHF